MADASPVRPLPFVKRSELEELATYVDDISNRLLIFETALASMISDFDALIEAVEAEDPGPTDGSAYVEPEEVPESETPEEEAERLRIEAIAAAEEGNEGV